MTIVYDTPSSAEAVEVVLEVLPHESKESITTLPPWQIALLFGVVFGLFGLGGGFSWILGPAGPADSSGEKEAVAVMKNPFDDVALVAEAAFVFDIARGETLYEKNAETQLPLASLAKLMTALVAEEILGDEAVVALDRNAIAEEGDSGLLVGEEWKKEDLVALTLLASSNDGAHALATAAEEALKNTATSTEIVVPTFAERMNARAGEIGLSQTYFLNAGGLDVHEYESGAYGSAHDVAKLLSYILAHEPQIFGATVYEKQIFTSLDGIAHTLKNTNDFISRLPGLVASKTGFTDLAGGNLAVIIEAGPMHPIAIVVLGSTAEERFTDVERLVWAALQKLNNE